MQLKDHYKTLDVQPVASMLQIKKSFRRLALLYHPDKNPNNAVAETTFKEIREAYETLIDPAKREEYNYRRWYSRKVKEAFTAQPLTPQAILRECVHLNDYIRTVNVLRIDFDGLSTHLRQLLSDQNIAILQQAGDENTNRKIIDSLLQPAALLPFRYLPPVAALLQRIAGNNEQLRMQINGFVKAQKQKDSWQKYKVPVVIAVTILICWTIYVISR